MKKLLILIAVILGFIVLSGCSMLGTFTMQPTPTLAPLPPTATVEIVFLTEIPLPTMALPTLEPTPTSTPTPQVFSPLHATVAFDNYILREGPGRLFPRVAMYSSGSPLMVLARAMGPDWVLVQTTDHRSGWMNTVGLEYLGDFSTLPIYQYPGAIMLTGHVWNVDRSPAALIGISLQPAGNTDPDLMEHLTTGSDGAWFAFLPVNTTGQWEVGPNSYGCPPEVPTGQCLLVGKFPTAQLVTLPDAVNVSIEFNILP